MRSIFQFFLSLIIAWTMYGPAAYAQNNALYLVTYVEAAPEAATPASALVKKYSDANSHEDGNLRTEVLQELERPNRFAIVETWRDILGPQVIDLVLLAGFLTLALVSFFRKSVRLKYVTLAVAVGYMGFVKRGGFGSRLCNRLLIRQRIYLRSRLRGCRKSADRQSGQHDYDSGEHRPSSYPARDP